MSTQPLKILLVEDNEDDYLIVRDLLAAVETQSFELKWASSYEEGLQEMASNRYDALMVDYRLAARTGVELLHEAEQRRCNAPIILLTGQSDPALNVQALRAGAADFLIKEDLYPELLARSVLYAMERKRSEEALRRSEERYRAFVANSSEAIWCCELEQPVSITLPVDEQIEQFYQHGYFAECNEAMAQMYGFAAPHEMVGMRLDDLLVRSNQANIEYLRAFIRSGHRLTDAESCEVDRDGRTKYFLNNLIAIIEDGTVQRVWGTQRDITQQRESEEMRSRLAAIVESSHDSIIDYSLDGTILHWNRGAERIYGYSFDEVKGQHISLLLPAERFDEWQQILDTINREGHFEQFESVRVNKDGSQFHVSLTASPVKDATGQITSVSVIARDITEHKQAQEALRESEANLSRAQQIAHLGSWELDLLKLNDITSNPLRWSDENFRLMGYEPGQIEVSNESFLRSVHPDDRERVLATMARALRGEQRYDIEHRVLWPDGSEHIIHGQADLILDKASGIPCKVVGTGQDVTERVHAAKAQAHLAAIVDSSADAIISKTMGGIIESWNRGAEQIFGYTSQEAIGRHISMLLPPDRHQEEDEILQKLRQGEFIQSSEAKRIRKDGEVIDIFLSISPHRNSNGEIIGASSISRDITAQKRAEAERARLLALLQTTLESTADGILVVSGEGRITHYNQQFIRMWQIPEDILKAGDSTRVIDFAKEKLVDPDTFATLARRIIADFEHEGFDLLYFKDGRVLERYTKSRGRANGDVGRILSYRDITERIRAEEALRVSEEKVRYILENSHDIIYQFNLKTETYDYISPAIEHLTGYNLEEIIAGGSAMVISMMHPDDTERSVAHLDSLITSTNRDSPDRISSEIEYRLKTRAGDDVWISDSRSVIFDADGVPATLIGTAREINERKRAEAERERLLALFQTTLETAADGILTVSPAGRVLSYNQRFAQLWEIPPEVLVTQDDAKLLEAALAKLLNPDEFLKRVAYLYEHPQERSEEEVALRDGRIFDRHSAPVIAADGTNYGRVWFFRDITERKRVEAGLQESEARKTAIFETALDCIISIDETGRVIEFNAAAEKTFGYTHDEAIGQLLADLIIPPALREHHQRGLAHFLATGEGPLINKRIEVAAMRADGTEFPSELAISPVHLGERTIFTGYLRDITERKQAEMDLQESQAQLRLLIQSLDDIVFEFDRQGVYINVWCNDETLLARPKTEIIGRPMTDILGQDVADPFLAAFQRVLNSGQAEDIEYELEAVAGRHFLARISPVIATDGSYKSICILSRDITKRKLAEQAREQLTLELQHERRRLNDILSTVPGVVWEAWGEPDAGDQRTNYVSDYVETMLGYSVGEWLATPNFWLSIVHPDDKEQATQAALRKFNSDRNKAGASQFRWVAKDGQILWVESQSVAVHDEYGNPIGMRGVTMDITASKQAEEELDRFFTLSIEMLAVIGTDGYFKRINPAWSHTLGHTTEELLSRPYLDFVHPEDHPATMTEAQRLAGGQVAVSFENRYRCADGSYRWLSWNSVAVPNQELIYSATQDITTRKQAEADLKRYAAQLKRSNRELQDFAYVASHDLQEPLRKIQTFSERLQIECSGVLSADGQDYVLRLQKASKRMQGLIQDLLSFSRLTTESQPLSTVNLQEIVGEVVDDLETSIEQAHARIEVGDLPLVEADPPQMRQMLQNLIGNALKFQPAQAEPLVKIHGHVTELRENLFGELPPTNALCHIIIEDNGIGFDEKHLERIFQPFQRLHGRNVYKGTGMGLSLCRKIAERHGGYITAKSVPGQGSTFIVTLPLTQSREDNI